jgi:hypothetical protein
MEKAPVTVYQSTSDASGIYRGGSGLSEVPSKGAADCGNLAAYIANSTFLGSQTVYVPVMLMPVFVGAQPTPKNNG